MQLTRQRLPASSLTSAETHFFYPLREERDKKERNLLRLGTSRHDQARLGASTVSELHYRSSRDAPIRCDARFHDSLCAFRKYVIHRPYALILPRWQPLNRPP